MVKKVKVEEAPAEVEAEDAPAAKYSRKALIEAVATASGQKKPAAKAVVDAVLAELSQALARGETLILPPLGKISVSRSKVANGSEVKVLKLRKLREAAGAPEADESSDD